MVNADIIELNTEQNYAQAIYERVPKKPGRPSKQTTQSATSTGIEYTLFNVAKTQIAIPLSLRSQKKS